MRFIGLDPGGDGQFGWCVAEGTAWPLSLVSHGCVRDAATAIQSLLERLGPLEDVNAVGIDSPMFWTPSGSRLVDEIVRKAIRKAGAPNVGGTVQHINSLRGACLIQGMVAAYLLRKAFPTMRITEAHPKALLWLIKVATQTRKVVDITMSHISEFITYNGEMISEHERDAALGTLAASAMILAPAGWRDISLEEKDVFMPVAPTEYWMPIPRDLSS
ncbi:MAG: DUF429 domain-containing protein [Desulfobacteraceae bacterium]|nr:MAG: DUF429 domain-containing protein [Desulfobacteraceae bacterium]